MFWFSLLACTVELPAPVVERVTPERGWNGEPTVISIEGRNFYPQVQINASRFGEADLDRGFVAWLQNDAEGRFPLSSVSALDYEHLRAVVDPGLPAGTYDVLVDSPGQSLALLERAFVVSDVRADRLVLSAPTITPIVNAVVPIAITLVDPYGDPVQTDMAVRLRIRGDGGVPDADVGLGLDGQTVDPTTLEVTGSLGVDGFAQVPLQVFEPETVSIEVEALDPDSGVAGDRLLQEWLPSTRRAVEILLPGPDYAITAGESLPLTLRLVDEFGNLITDSPVAVALETTCGDVRLTIDALVGEQVAVIRPTAATDLANPCDEQRVRVVTGPAGESAPFVVHAGPADRFALDALAPQVRAGNDVLAILTTLDAYGNRTVLPGHVELRDSLGSLGPASCAPSLVGDLNCFARATVAAQGVYLIASSGDVVGTSLPYDVLPSTALGSLVVEPPAAARVGEVEDVLLDPRDPFGNRMLPDEVPPITLSGDGGNDPDCSFAGATPDGRLRYGCIFEQARSQAVLTAQAHGVVAHSAPFSVLNGPPGTVVITAPSAVSAGVTFDATVEVFDDYGNPYVDPVGVMLELFDDGGQVAVPLDPVDGIGVAQITLTAAGLTQLGVRAAGTVVGGGAVVEVVPGPAEILTVEAEEPWAFAGLPSAVGVELRDAWGNRAAWDGAFTLSGDGQQLTGQIVDGRGDVDWSWSTPTLGAVLEASAAGLTGTSAPIIVVESCASGPLARIDFGGAPVGRACVDPDGGPVPVSLSLGGSVAGAAALTRYAALVDRTLYESFSPDFLVDVDGVGEHAVRALVIDQQLCGSEVDASIWAGPDDGSPVGPLDAAGPPSLAIGDVGTYTLAGLVDCTGDPAAGAALWIRTDRGRIGGATPTGSGLVLPIDTFGGAVFSLDLTGVATGGPTRIAFGTLSGGARGARTVAVSGDDEPPRVWFQTPAGHTTTPVGAVHLRFSEPVLAGVGAGFTVSGPGNTTITDVLWDVDAVTLILDPPADPLLGTWTVEAIDVRDISGNRLDGADVGAASPWVGRFGPDPVAVAPVSCMADVLTFRPDGDPGVGYEADEVDIQMESALQPAAWVASVRTAEGIDVDVRRIPATGTTGMWRWDGRGAGGAILPDGTYTVVVEAEDTAGNRVDGCVLQVTLDNERSDG